MPYRDVCGRCGARRVDRQIGLEPTPDEFVQSMVAVFREVRRVLRADGTLWLNLGDSYNANGREGHGTRIGAKQGTNRASANGLDTNRPTDAALKPKDLVGIPWRVAFALQQPYYTGRIASERDRAWLAAILDGEGTICGMRHTRPDGNVRTGCMVFITNTSEALLDECDRIWKGARYSEKITSEASRPCWRWELQQAEDRSALVRELYPYLIEKKQQALVAWNLLELVQAAKRMGRGGETLATKEKRDYLVRLLSDLNQRRPADLPSWLAPVPDLYEPGWYLRSDVIWAKNNPMPESVTDRPTKSHEYVFLLSKSPRYFFDQEAVREKWADGRMGLSYPNGVPEQQDSKGNPNRNDGGHTSSARGPDGRRKTGVRGADGSIQHRDGERWPNGGRNVRSVWEIATQPYPDAHFATFPEALPERCIKAGTSERGCCPECGAPWERVVVATGADNARVRENVGDWIKHKGGNADGKRSLSGATYKPQRAATDEWRPTCTCVRADGASARLSNTSPDPLSRGSAVAAAGAPPSPIPCTVLDPFMGSGTTAVMALRLGRHAVGVELNPEYAALCEKRVSTWWKRPATTRTEVPDEQEALFS